MLKAFLDVVRLFLYIEEPVRLVSNILVLSRYKLKLNLKKRNDGIRRI